MPLNIRDEEVNRLATKLAAQRGVTKTDAVKLALENELRKSDNSRPLRDRIKAIQDEILSYPATGLEADKAFYDSLNDE
ncbi:MAG: type II toxin-antitoxin system VapB family antitoxin [Rhizobiales bacterium]|nr:type II toxin-antitoxin system VapB family antitoxin [Hyphomicrobiales bacterium]